MARAIIKQIILIICFSARDPHPPGRNGDSLDWTDRYHRPDNPICKQFFFNSIVTDFKKDKYKKAEIVPK